MNRYAITEKAGRFVAGQTNTGVGTVLKLTDKQAEHELRLGTLRALDMPDMPDTPKSMTKGSRAKKPPQTGSDVGAGDVTAENAKTQDGSHDDTGHAD
jgi:hypothetical protein